MSNHRAIIQAFYEEIWHKHNTSQMPELLHENFAFRGSLGQEPYGHAGFAAYVDCVHAALRNYRCEIQAVSAEGNTAFARLLCSGMPRAAFCGSQPTGKRVEWAGAAVCTCAGEKISALGGLVMSMGYYHSVRTTRIPKQPQGLSPTKRVCRPQRGPGTFASGLPPGYRRRGGCARAKQQGRWKAVSRAGHGIHTAPNLAPEPLPPASAARPLSAAAHRGR